MQFKVENIEQNLVKITIEITPEQLAEGIKHAYNKNKGSINLSGFRKGKAPLKLIEMQFGKEIFFDDAIEFALPPLYEQAVIENKLDVVSRPDIDVIEISHEKGAVVECEVYTKPEATVTNYIGLSYSPAEMIVTADDVNAEIDKARDKNSRMLTITDRPVQNGDIAIINYEGFKDGVPFEGGKGENHELNIGSHSFIDNFEEQVIGHNIGDEFEVNVRFPDEYHAEELKGAPAMFRVQVNEIKCKELPEANDDFAQDVSEFDTFDEYKAEVAAKLKSDKEKKAESEKENAIIDQLVENTEVDVPAPMIENQVDQNVNEFSQRVQQMGMNLETYLGFMQMDVEGLRKNYRFSAEKNIKARLALEAVAKAENFEASKEDIEIEIERMSKEHGIETDKLKEVIRLEDMDGIVKDIIVQKALKYVIEKSIVK